MAWPVPIARELAGAAAAWQSGNDGKARVCARRAVALADEAWLAQQTSSPWFGDAMAHLRRIQQDVSFPSAVRQAAERLTTTVTKKQTAPFTADPIGDANTIIAFLIGGSDGRP
ncbi:hypothetical protein [Nitrospira lenta]|uniref:Uncharacterized protein n=1 Tax=Nitrospira lenta TaxID=1436998 RepID=A0A330L7D7_9BACT|nr:hypothetical protein [Nitrospira lenta]SPP65062.1 conserved hypothetical protein [Nitrospira lenta]